MDYLKYGNKLREIEVMKKVKYIRFEFENCEDIIISVEDIMGMKIDIEDLNEDNLNQSYRCNNLGNLVMRINKRKKRTYKALMLNEIMVKKFCYKQIFKI